MEVLPHLRLVSPEGKVVLEESGPSDKVLDDVKNKIATPVPDAGHAPVYTCPMHPEVLQSAPGSCPKCGMQLEPTKNQLDH